MRVFIASLALIGSVASMGTASALSAMPVTGNPYPTAIFTIALILLIVGMFVIARRISRLLVERMRNRGDFEGLVNALKRPFLARNAARALGESKDQRAIGPLVAALGDRDEDVRCAAAKALGDIGDVQAEAPLVRALHDECKEVRDCASFAIKRIHKTSG